MNTKTDLPLKERIFYSFEIKNKFSFLQNFFTNHYRIGSENAKD